MASYDMHGFVTGGPMCPDCTYRPYGFRWRRITICKAHKNWRKPYVMTMEPMKFPNIAGGIVAQCVVPYGESGPPWMADSD